MTRALITGITGQDGSYLAEQLLGEGAEVWGLVRRTSHADAVPPRLASVLAQPDLAARLHLVDGDLLDLPSLLRAVREARPDEVYNLAAQSFVGRSWREPEHTAEVSGLGALRVFEAVRLERPEARVYQASTSEMYGELSGRHATAQGPFQPRSPYGTAKLFAHTTAAAWRASYGMFVCSGILFNHESPRRGLEFVTRKVCRGAARAAAGDREPLRLGNLHARRDWGWAPDYVDAMVRMVRHPRPLELVVATGVSHSVADLCAAAYAAVGLDWRDHVRSDVALERPADIEDLRGDPAGAEAAIGWRPTVSFEELVQRMVRAEVDELGASGSR
jgi:GDPmannose 4,6-dehydratase